MIIQALIVFIMASSIAYAVAVPMLIAINNRYLKRSLGMPVEGRKVIVCITTYGKASDVITSKIIPAIRSYSLPVRIIVLTEYFDSASYGVETIRVPEDYSTPNGSLNKHRALHYFSQWLKDNNIGSDTYILHIDDDNIPDSLYIENVFSMPYDAGEGTIRLREYDHHVMATLGDFQRVTYYDAFNVYANRHFKPLGVGGEGLTIRADIEAEIGWDYGPIAAEDFLMGQSIYHHGYTFGFIPGAIYLAPVTSTKDFFLQRRRWMHHFLVSIRKAIMLNSFATLFFAYMYLSGFIPIVGAFVWLVSSINHVSLPLWISIALLYEFIIGFFTTLYGSFRHKGLKWKMFSIVLQLPLTIYLIGTWIYFILTVKKIDKRDHVAKKV